MIRRLASLLFIIFPLVSAGQSQLAKLKFEQAEESFNDGNSEVVIAKLDEVEKILGASNPKILHLRILAEHKTVTGNLAEQFPLLQKLRSHTAFFLENYKIKGLEALYNDVYKINESMASLPKTKEEILSRKKIADDAENNRVDEERKKLSESRNYITSIEEKYKFKKETPLKEFLNQNKESSILFKSDGIKSGDLTYYNIVYKGTNPYPIGPYAARVDSDNNIVYYAECLFSVKDNPKSASEYFMNLKKQIEEKVDANYLTYENDGTRILINVLGTDVSVELNHITFKNWKAITITFKDIQSNQSI